MEIQLTKGLSTVIDETDEWLTQWKWCATRGKSGTFYAGRRDPISGGTLLMHRLIMDAPKGVRVDHINTNSLDNRRVNLRFATHAQNLRNRGAQKNNSSGYKGVSWDRGRWVAKIKVNYRQYHLGRFSTPEQAAAAYAEAAKRLHGDFARVA